MNLRKKNTTAIAMALALAFALAVGVGQAFAAPPFELDGNATSSGTVPGEDWDVVNFGPGNSVARTGLIVDRPEPAFAQFQTGGSKDQQDIPNWRHTGGAPTNKTDITNAYAAAYVHPEDGTARAGNLILVFGMDRFDTSGDAQLGFWFLQDNVQPVAGGTFSGVHVDGDILVLVNFSGGGDTPTIEVFQWQGTGLVSLGVGGDVLCTGGFIPAGQNFCGITNSGNVPAPWAYENKDVGVTTQFPPGAFFEGAVDLTALGIEVCITNFLAESRSSTSITATLQDFATPAGGFQLCKVELSKTCGTGRFDAARDLFVIPYSVTVTNTGGIPVTSVTVSDDSCTQGVTGDDVTLTFGPLAGGLSETQNRTCELTAAQIPDPPTPVRNGVRPVSTDPAGIPVVLAQSCDRLSAFPDFCFDPCQLDTTPTIDVVKNCVTRVVAEGGVVKVRVLFNGNVTNTSDQGTSPAPVPLENVQVLDNLTNQLLELFDATGTSVGTSTTLDPGDRAFFQGFYDPTSVNSECPEEASFTNMVTARGDDIVTGTRVNDSSSATCQLCPGGCEQLPPDPIP